MFQCYDNEFDYMDEVIENNKQMFVILGEQHLQLLR